MMTGLGSGGSPAFAFRAFAFRAFSAVNFLISVRPVFAGLSVFNVEDPGDVDLRLSLLLHATVVGPPRRLDPVLQC